jgi:hypothetical protein
VAATGRDTCVPLRNRNFLIALRGVLNREGSVLFASGRWETQTIRYFSSHSSESDLLKKETPC